jgi:hypothetical protein
MMARATAPRAPANRNDLSEDKRLDPEQSVTSANPPQIRSSYQSVPGSSNRGNSHSHRPVFARPAECRFSTVSNIALGNSNSAYGRN